MVRFQEARARQSAGGPELPPSTAAVRRPSASESAAVEGVQAEATDGMRDQSRQPGRDLSTRAHTRARCPGQRACRTQAGSRRKARSAAPERARRRSGSGSPSSTLNTGIIATQTAGLEGGSCRTLGIPRTAAECTRRGEGAGDRTRGPGGGGRSRLAHSALRSPRCSALAALPRTPSSRRKDDRCQPRRPAISHPAFLRRPRPRRLRQTSGTGSSSPPASSGAGRGAAGGDGGAARGGGRWSPFGVRLLRNCSRFVVQVFCGGETAP